MTSVDQMSGETSYRTHDSYWNDMTFCGRQLYNSISAFDMCWKPWNVCEWMAVLPPSPPSVWQSPQALAVVSPLFRHCHLVETKVSIFMSNTRANAINWDFIKWKIKFECLLSGLYKYRTQSGLRYWCSKFSWPPSRSNGYPHLRLCRLYLKNLFVA